MLSRFARGSRAPASALARRAAPALTQRRNFIAGSEEYGKHCFKGAVADACAARLDCTSMPTRTCHIPRTVPPRWP